MRIPLKDKVKRRGLGITYAIMHSKEGPSHGLCPGPPSSPVLGRRSQGRVFGISVTTEELRLKDAANCI